MLICDLLETYRIENYRIYPPSFTALLAVNLHPDSRIKMKMSGLKIPFSDILLAGILDRLSFLCWAKTKDGQKGKNRPESVLAKFSEEKCEGYTIDEFEKLRKKIIGRRGS